MSPTRKCPFSTILAAGILLCVCFGAAPPLAVGQAANSHTRIAFGQSNAQTPGGDIYTMDPDGSNIRQLTSLGANKASDSPSWSADGRLLVFDEYPNFGPGQLWLMDSDGSNLHLLLAEAAFGDYAPNFSPDGKWVVFYRCADANTGNGCAIYRIRSDGSHLTAVTNFQLEVTDYQPAYSPDGRSIAFSSNARGGVLGAVYVTDPFGADVRQVTPPILGGYDPHWSSDGEKISFIDHCCDPQNQDVWQVSRDGSELSRLTGSGKTDLQLPPAYYGFDPSWSPDGRSVVFQQYVVSTNTVGIFVVKTGDDHPGTPILILANAYNPAWSPELYSHDARELRTRK